MTLLKAGARIALSDPAAVLEELCEHLVEHGAEVERIEGGARIRLDETCATLTVADGVLSAEITAAELQGLHGAKFAVASHVREFAGEGEAARIAWSGDGAGAAPPPDFRLLAVTEVRDITPHMRRIRFGGEGLARFAGLDAIHVRLFLPRPGHGEPVWPVLGEDGLIRHAPEEKRPAVRKYTIREIDPAAGTLAIDFVLHDDAGPGAAFAATARPGDRIGMAGPGGRGLVEARRYVFLADETGLPAVGRMLEALPADAGGLALIEVAGPQEEQALAAPAGVAVRWLHRAEGGPSGLAEAFDGLSWPEEGPETYLWVAAEHEAFRRIRVAARERLRPGRDKHLIVSYWRAGLAEEQHAAQKKAAA